MKFVIQSMFKGGEDSVMLLVLRGDGFIMKLGFIKLGPLNDHKEKV